MLPRKLLDGCQRPRLVGGVHSGGEITASNRSVHDGILQQLPAIGVFVA